MDHIGYSLNLVASWIAHWLHDGWGHSYPAGHRHHHISGPTYSGTKNIAAVDTHGQARVCINDYSYTSEFRGRSEPVSL